jgi:hypothetical protein
MPAFAPHIGRELEKRRSAHRTYEDPRVELAQARESLAYWEKRAARLPRRAVRKRREARELAYRWRGRVVEAERAAYGKGLLGLLVLIAVERRLPESTRRSSRRVARRTAQTLTLVAVTGLALLVVVMVALVEVLLTILRAVGS